MENTTKSQLPIDPIDIDVKPDNQAAHGYTLNQLFSYLQWAETGDTNQHMKFGNWEKCLGQGRLGRTDKKYITTPIRINLFEGQYEISFFVRIYTKSNVEIIGQGKGTLIQFKRFDSWGKHDIQDGDILRSKDPLSHPRGVDRLIVIGSPSKYESTASEHKENRLILQDFSIRLESGKWYPTYEPYMKPVNGKGVESPVGMLLSYDNFHQANLSGLDIKIQNNGELTILDGDECDHQTLTGCDLYLDNWNDRTSGQWARIREQGDIFNVRGNNKSVMISDNAFIKHGNDEIIAFLNNNSYNSNIIPDTYLHENICVIRNTFTYIDAQTEGTVLPDKPVGPDIPVGPITPVNSSSGDVIVDDNREVHVNDRLIGFLPIDEARSTWRNVLFSENTLYLQGPVVEAVSMAIYPGDRYQNVKFTNNSIYHSYRHNGRLPGNMFIEFNNNTNKMEIRGADVYWRSASFVFEIREKESSSTDGKTVEAKNNSDSVAYFGNSIFYSQHTHDFQSPVDPNYRLPYEHSCFMIYGGRVYIHGNSIDGTEAVVRRLEDTYGMYGKIENPISLLHCMPCPIKGAYSVRMVSNQAVGYSAVLRCRGQNEFKEVLGYTIMLADNFFSDGATCIINLLRDSSVNIIHNRFSNCSKDSMFCGEGSMTDVKLNITQNIFDLDQPICLGLCGKDNSQNVTLNICRNITALTPTRQNKT